MTRVLVTGGGGFVGRPLLEYLLRAGHEVHAVVRRVTHDLPSAVRTHPADLLAPEVALSLPVEIGAEALVHLAWCTDPAGYRGSLENLAWVEATLRLLRGFAAAGGRRAILAGSVMEYDPTASECREDGTRLAPDTLYGASKAALGLLSRSLGESLGLSVVWARLFWLYGPGERPGRLVSSLVSGLLRGERVALGPGTERRDYLHVDDAARALAGLVDSGLQGDVNVASGTAVEVATIARAVERLLNRPGLVAIGARPAPAQLNPSIRDSGARLATELGFLPAFQLEAGLRDTIAWWRVSGVGQPALT